MFDEFISTIDIHDNYIFKEVLGEYVHDYSSEAPLQKSKKPFISKRTNLWPLSALTSTAFLF